jgi:hypothetical protein
MGKKCSDNGFVRRRYEEMFGAKIKSTLIQFS